jgi:Protein of unknown function (DUF2950)
MSEGQNQQGKSFGWLLAAIVVVAGICLAVWTMKNHKSASATDAAPQVTFSSPADAAAALAQATKNTDGSALAKVLGNNAKALITSGDKESDNAAMQQFSSKYQQMNRWVNMTDGSRVLYIGADNFAFPVPLAKNASGQWYFDSVAGAQEIRAREIGRNELRAIDAVAVLANAERFYAFNNDAGEYAQRIVATAGEQDGLYWPASASLGASPLAQLDQLPKSSVSSLSPDQPVVIDGYTFRILTAQGDAVISGARNYIVDGKMIGGFGILATPVKYGETGIMSFIIGPDPKGFIYEQDLGPDTAKLAASIQQYDPDDNWSPID